MRVNFLQSAVFFCALAHLRMRPDLSTLALHPRICRNIAAHAIQRARMAGYTAADAGLLATVTLVKVQTLQIQGGQGIPKIEIEP